jgi:hypothetical protein
MLFQETQYTEISQQLIEGNFDNPLKELTEGCLSTTDL